jgi:hypothetical protein
MATSSHQPMECRDAPAAVAAGLLLHTSTGMALETKPTLTLDLAKKMAAACDAKAKQEKWLMNISVVDDGANLVYFEQMEPERASLLSRRGTDNLNPRPPSGESGELALFSAGNVARSKDAPATSRSFTRPRI